MNVTKNKDLKNYAINKPNINNFFSYNRSPQPINKMNFQKNNPFSISEPTKKYEYEDNFDKNININDYLNNNQVNFYQNKNRNKQKSPFQTINYNRNYNIKHFESDDIDNNNININYKNNKAENNYNNYQNYKNKIRTIKDQNKNEYAQYINPNYGNNNIYNYNNYFNGNYYNNNFNESYNYNVKPLPQFTKGNIDPYKNNKIDNYENYNKNKNRNRVIKNNNNINKDYHKYSKDYSGTNINYLSDNNLKNKDKNQTQDNYYKKAHKNLNKNNNDSSSSNFFDDSYDYKTQYNFAKNRKQKMRNFAKFYGTSSIDNSYSDFKEEENYSTSPFRLPLKNDEKHYHQNLTIKIKNPEPQQKPLIKYVDNTPEGCIVLESNKNMEKRKQLNLNINQANINKDALDKNKNYPGNKTKIEFSDQNKNENKNELPKKCNKKLSSNNNNNDNRTLESYVEKNNKISEIIEKKKKIREIALNISPKKKLKLSNSNQNLESKINKIQNITSSNISNIDQNQNSKIESCIITFEKNDKNNSKFNLSNSLDKMVTNKIRYIKKKVIISNTHKNFLNKKETPGINNKENKNGSMKKIYQKPGKESLSRSNRQSMENLEINNEVKDYCAPSPNYGKKGKEAYLRSQNNKSGNINISINNNSPVLLSSGKFNLLDSNKKADTSPFKNIKFEEFSFKDNDNDFNNIKGQKSGINIIFQEDNDDFNNNKKKNNFRIFNQRRVPSFSSYLLNQNENEIKINDKNKENIVSKLVIKSFSNKAKEIKEKPKLIYNFYKKYYDIYVQIPEKEKIYMTKCVITKGLEQKNDESYNKIRKKYLNKKLINAPIRGKMMDISVKDFYNRNKNNYFSFNAVHSLNSNNNNTLDIELDENKNTISSKKGRNTNIKIRTVIKKIKVKEKKGILSIFNSNKGKMNINIESLMKGSIKTKEQIKREKKINSILKEDFENYIIYNKNINNKGKKYDWSTVELLMIKIKLDIGDIINGYLKICEDLITEDEYVIIGNDYIKNIIQHYKNNYLTNKNIEEIHNKFLKIFLFIKDINIDLEYKYKILWGVLCNLIDNELFYISDFDILKQSDEDSKKNIKKVLELCNDEKILEKINF